MIFHTYANPYTFIQRGQMRRGDFIMMRWYRDMTVDLGVASLGAMMQMKSSTRWRWLWMMVGHHDRWMEGPSVRIEDLPHGSDVEVLGERGCTKQQLSKRGFDAQLYGRVGEGGGIGFWVWNECAIEN